MTPLKTISEKLSAWRRYRDAVRELSQLSDRELEDIGVRRGDIEFVVRRSVDGAERRLIVAVPPRQKPMTRPARWRVGSKAAHSPAARLPARLGYCGYCRDLIAAARLSAITRH